MPVVGRHVPVIADARVEPDFGSGALKITPGHDPDRLRDRRRDHRTCPTADHVIGPDGRMDRRRGRVRGADAGGGRAADPRLAERARPARAAASSYRHSVGTCERCHTRIEPLVRRSGGARMDELAAPRDRRAEGAARRASTRRASTASRSSRSRRRPTGASRGSSGGVTSCRSGAAPTVTSRSPGRRPTACAECGAGLEPAERSQDVLDTWFSSALWPFATLGWPRRRPSSRATTRAT